MRGTLEFENVSKRYGNIQALNRVSFTIRDGDFFSILGSSGCGKTTLLRLIAGFEQPDTGRILLDGEDISHLPPERRPLNTVFQNYALFPHLTLYDNIAFGLRIAKRPKEEVAHEVEKMLKMIRMEEHAWKKPHEISGGQKQRVALARALVNKPRLLLLDEPLSALDLKLRQHMLFELSLIHAEVGITFLLVTHDQSEAMSVSDHIAVMHQGKVEQIGTPHALYNQPKSSFVAAFIGDTNFLDGHVLSQGEEEQFTIQVEGLPPLLCQANQPPAKGTFVHLSVRPESIHIARTQPEDVNNLLCGVVSDVVYLGDHTKLWIQVGETLFNSVQRQTPHPYPSSPFEEGEKVWIWWSPKDGYLLERFSEEDADLTQMPPESVGETLIEDGEASL